jgi:hypothetical protein
MRHQASPLLRVTAVAALNALSWAILFPATAVRAQEQQPPACSDEAWIKSVKRQYNTVEEIQQRSLKIKDLKDVRETHYGPAPKSFNQYANSNDHVLNVRWCQATLTLSDGQADTLYWFLADELEGTKHSTVLDHCSPKHSFDPSCAKYREHS